MPIIQVNLTANQRKKLIRASESSEPICFRIDKNSMTGSVPITVDEETARKHEIALKNGKGMKISPLEITAGSLDSAVLHTDPDPKQKKPVQKKKKERIIVKRGKNVQKLGMNNLLEALPQSENSEETESETTSDQVL